MVRYLALPRGARDYPVLGAALLIFLAWHYASGDPVQTLLGDHYNPETASHMRHYLGLDRPLAVQFVT